MANVAPLYLPKDDFLTSCLEEMALEAVMNCSICREPLGTATTTVAAALSHLPTIDKISLPRIIAAQDDGTHLAHVQTQIHFVDTPEEPEDTYAHIPEPAVCIRHCAHVFGKTCLSTWFSTNKSNRCPECNKVFFPERRKHLTLREPTREMRIEFAYIVETMLEDVETAKLIRQKLMSRWTRVIKRELALLVHRAEGCEVTCEDLGVAASEEADDIHDVREGNLEGDDMETEDE